MTILICVQRDDAKARKKNATFEKCGELIDIWGKNYALSFNPAKIVSGLKAKTEAISPDMQKRHKFINSGESFNFI